MQGSHSAGDIFVTNQRRTEEHFTQVPAYNQGGDRGPQLLHVQPITEGGLEHRKRVLRPDAWQGEGRPIRRCERQHTSAEAGGTSGTDTIITLNNRVYPTTETLD